MEPVEELERGEVSPPMSAIETGVPLYIASVRNAIPFTDVLMVFAGRCATLFPDEP